MSRVHTTKRNPIMSRINKAHYMTMVMMGIINVVGLSACQFLLEQPLTMCTHDSQCSASQTCDLTQNICVYMLTQYDLDKTAEVMDQSISTDSLKLPDYKTEREQFVDLTVDLGPLPIDMSQQVLEPLRPSCSVQMGKSADLLTLYTAESPLIFCHDKTLIILIEDDDLQPLALEQEDPIPMIDRGVQGDTGDTDQGILDQNTINPNTFDQGMPDQNILDQMMPNNDMNVSPGPPNSLLMYRLVTSNGDQLAWQPICHNIRFAKDIQAYLRISEKSIIDDEENDVIFTFSDSLHPYANSNDAKGLWDIILPATSDTECELTYSSLLGETRPKVLQHNVAKDYHVLYSENFEGKNLRLFDLQSQQPSRCLLNETLHYDQTLWGFTIAHNLITWIQQSNFQTSEDSYILEISIYNQVLPFTTVDSMNDSPCPVNDHILMGDASHLTPQQRLAIHTKNFDYNAMVFCYFQNEQCTLSIWSPERTQTNPQNNFIYKQGAQNIYLTAPKETFDVLDRSIAYIKNQVVDGNLSYQALSKATILPASECTEMPSDLCYDEENTVARAWRFGMFKFYLDSSESKLWWFQAEPTGWSLHKE